MVHLIFENLNNSDAELDSNGTLIENQYHSIFLLRVIAETVVFFIDVARLALIEMGENDSTYEYNE